MKRDIMKLFDACKSQGSGPPGVGSEGKGGGKGIDKQEIAIWKFPHELDKQAFRHWFDAAYQQLEFVHGFKLKGGMDLAGSTGLNS